MEEVGIYKPSFDTFYNSILRDESVLEGFYGYLMSVGYSEEKLIEYTKDIQTRFMDNVDGYVDECLKYWKQLTGESLSYKQ